MDDQERGANWGLGLLVAVAISLMATITETIITSLAPLVVPQLCAAAVGLKLPSRQFLLLSILVATAICLPMIVDFGGNHVTSRAIALLGLLVLASIRIEPLHPSLKWLRGRGAVLAPSSDSSMPTPYSTRLHDTEHSGRGGSESEDGFDLVLTNAILPPALERLKASGLFDSKQMRMIETEMRLLEGHSIPIDYGSALQKGDQVGRFLIEEPLGRGGEGNVFRGFDKQGNQAAIKILHNIRVSDRFRREMRLARHLAHPNIVTAYEVGEFRGLPFITMELLKGPDLRVLVRDSGPLDWMVSSSFILQTARALSHAHRRDLIHRDVKPGNIIMNGEGAVKLVDLGLAALCGSDTMDSVFQAETLKGHLAGTLPFIAPEQARSLANATPRSDIYGLGATWFYLLTGKTRLRGKTFAEHFENLLIRRHFRSLPRDCMPRALRKIYRRMVAYEVQDRYANCEELVRDIESALETAGESVYSEDINVLVVEDNRTDMLFTMEMLRKANASLKIHEATSLAQGIELYHQLPIDLVVLDLALPDSSGVETVKRFRDAAKQVPLVVLTGCSREDIGPQSLASGADTFILKSGLTAYRIERAIFVTLSQRGSTQRFKG